MKRPTYTAAQKRAIQNYRNRDRERTRITNKTYYEKSKVDPNFVLNRNEKAKCYYHKRKLMKSMQ